MASDLVEWVSGVAYPASEAEFWRFHLDTYNVSLTRLTQWKNDHFVSVLLVIRCTMWVYIYIYE